MNYEEEREWSVEDMWAEPTQVVTRSYTTMCKSWRKLRDDEPPTYADWVKGVIEGRLLVAKQ